MDLIGHTHKYLVTNRSAVFASTGSGLWRPLLLHAVLVEEYRVIYLPRRSPQQTNLSILGLQSRDQQRK